MAAADGLTGLSAERVRDEWFKSLQTAQSLHRLVQLWRDSGAATRMLPELIGPPDAETIWALRAPRGEVPRDPVLLTVLLCRRPAEVLERLRCSNSIIRRAAGIDHGPRQPEGADAVSVRHWLSAVGPVAGDNAELARLRDGKAPPWWTVAEEVLQRGDPLTRKDLKIGGEDLLAAGVPAGPRLGEVLERLLRVVLDDPSKNTREALLALAKEMT